ncbi:hypothetical protein [[Mycoplasma] collis]|uniref:hypothetical protein n=1 Tax=[Mycoplasma] collis TaxID=2127 RepID=UPI0012EBB541|nr:hypothetical protein [[Mycoplasma] collis]
MIKKILQIKLIDNKVNPTRKKRLLKARKILSINEFPDIEMKMKNKIKIAKKEKIAEYKKYKCSITLGKCVLFFTGGPNNISLIFIFFLILDLFINSTKMFILLINF